MKMQKDINLISHETRAMYRKKMLTFAIAFTVLILIGSLLPAYILPQRMIRNLKSENQEVKRRLALVDDVNQVVEKMKQKEGILKSKEDLIRTIHDEKVRVSDIVKKVTSNLPDNVYITSLTISKGTALNVSFVVKDPVDAAKLIIQLKESNLFDNVDTASLPLSEGNSTLTFNLIIKPKNTN